MQYVDVRRDEAWWMRWRAPSVLFFVNEAGDRNEAAKKKVVALRPPRMSSLLLQSSLVATANLPLTLLYKALPSSFESIYETCSKFETEDAIL